MHFLGSCSWLSSTQDVSTEDVGYCKDSGQCTTHDSPEEIQEAKGNYISSVFTVVYVVFHFKFVCKFDVFIFYFFPQYDYRHHIEALRLKKKEERELKEAGNKRAKEIAEQNYRVRLYFNVLFSAVTNYLVE